MKGTRSIKFLNGYISNFFLFAPISEHKMLANILKDIPLKAFVMYHADGHSFIHRPPQRYYQTLFLYCAHRYLNVRFKYVDKISWSSWHKQSSYRITTQYADNDIFSEITCRVNGGCFHFHLIPTIAISKHLKTHPIRWTMKWNNV